MTATKPRSRTCWFCHQQLWGNHFKELMVDYHPRILHKQCAKEIENDDRDFTKTTDGYISWCGNDDLS